MAKWLLYLILAGGLSFFTYRRRHALGRRLKLAVSVVMVGYPLSLVLRFILRPPQESQLLMLAEVFVAFGLIWLSIWLLASRRDSHPR